MLSTQEIQVLASLITGYLTIPTVGFGYRFYIKYIKDKSSVQLNSRPAPEVKCHARHLYILVKFGEAGLSRN